MFTVTIKAGSPAEREQRVQDLLVKGYHVVKYLEVEKHNKVFSGTRDKRNDKRQKFEGTTYNKIYAAVMRIENRA